MGAPASAAAPRRSSDASVLQSINDEFIALYDYLEKHKVCGSEAERLLQPLHAVIQGQPESSSISPVGAMRKTLQTLRPAATFCGCAAVVLVAVAALWQVPLLSKLLLVLVRHLQVLVLPLWDWSGLYYADCLVSNPFYSRPGLTLADCGVCEMEDTLATLADVEVDVATDQFLRDDRPFIVTDAMADWPVMNTDDFWFDNVTELYRSEQLQHLQPCELSTSLRAAGGSLQNFLQRLHQAESWYGHWENCDKRAAKALRGLYQRPYFMPHMVDFSDTNWVFLSSDYSARVYKQVAFQSEVLWVGVVRGWLRVRVVPQSPCNSLCPELTAPLMEGHMLVLTSRLWRLEYIPGHETDNLAIAVGGFWN